MTFYLSRIAALYTKEPNGKWSTPLKRWLKEWWMEMA